MQPNNQQNYWQPQDEAEAPTTGAQQPEAAASPPKQKAQPPAAPQEPPKNTANNTTPESAEISWQASEAIEHAKGPVWYAVFITISLVIFGALIWFQEWIFAALVVVVAVTVIVMSRRPARVFDYTLNDSGLMINGEMHYFTEFRAFGIVRDEAFFAIKLIPIQRFSPETMVYFSERDGEKIVDILGAHLPMESMKLDLADRIIRKIRL